MAEGLEGRQMFAAGYGPRVSPADSITDFNGGAVRFTHQFGYQTQLVVCGSDGDDTIKVTPADTSGQSWRVEINGLSQVFTDPSGHGVASVDLYGYGGNDRLELDLSAANQPNATTWWHGLHGGDGDDALLGADLPGFWQRDLLYGGAGDDTLIARGGEDLLQGGAGHDKLYGGAGADKLWGDTELLPPQTYDVYDGGAQGDLVNGVEEQTKDNWTKPLGGGSVAYRETSFWWGTAADLTLSGTAGDDVIRVSAGYNDTLRIEINGGVHRVPAAAMLGAQWGAWVYVYAGEGNDRVELNLTAAQRARFGFAGLTVDGGAGDDVMIGSGARDEFRSGAGRDVIQAGGGDDMIEVEATAADAGTVVDAGGGNDTIRVGRDAVLDPVRGWVDVYSGTTAGVTGGTGLDTLNDVTEAFDADRDTEPPPSAEPDPEPQPEPDGPAPEFMPVDEGTLTDEQVMALAMFVGPLGAAEYEAFESALAAQGDVSERSPQSAPLLAWPVMAPLAPAVDGSGTGGEDEVDELLA